MSTKKSGTSKDIKSEHYFQRVYDITCLIPYGRVSTYGAIADFLALGSARMVGWALNHCHSADTIIPAHRVVNRKGELSGRLHSATPALMIERLESVVISISEDDKVDKMEELFWHPRELENY